MVHYFWGEGVGGGGQIFQLKVRFYDFDFHGLIFFLKRKVYFSSKFLPDLVLKNMK